MDSIIKAINDQKLLMGDKIPSINAASEMCNLSRDTVEKAYSLLRAKNIIVSVKGKGFYVTKTNMSIKLNVLFLINKLSSYKMRIYNEFTETLGTNALVDLDIYHCEPDVFINILNKKKKSYSHYVIMPHFRNDRSQHVGCSKKILTAINEIPAEKLIILDREVKNLSKASIKIYQDFTNDIYTALNLGMEQLKKYKKIILVYPSKAIYPYPKEIVQGFRKFCLKNEFEYEILDEIYDSMELQIKDLYIIIQEQDLVSLVKQVRDRHFKLGEDIGIISYNDTPLKALLGITVISTDFKKMGATAAKMILNKQTYTAKNDFNFFSKLNFPYLTFLEPFNIIK